mgnify:CR=1 FL=1
MPPRQTEPGSPAVSSIDALLQAFASEKFGRDAQSIRRLTGGASQEIWQINMAEDEAYIVRRPPGGEIKPGANQVTPDDEVKLLQIAFKAGICVPEIVHSFQHDEPLYPGYVMRFIAGAYAKCWAFLVPMFPVWLTRRCSDWPISRFFQQCLRKDRLPSTRASC